MGDDTGGQLGELAVGVGGGEVLHVVGGDGELAVGGRDGHLALEVVVLQRAEVAGDQGVAAELVVVQRAVGDAGQHVAHVGDREGLLGDGRLLLHHQPADVRLRVGLVEHAAALALLVLLVGGDPQLVVLVGGLDHPDVADLDQHALQRLVEVEGVLLRVQGDAVDRPVRAGRRGVGAGDVAGVDDHRGRQRVAGGDHGDGRVGQLGERLRAAGEVRVVLRHLAGDQHRVADLDGRVGGAGVDEDALAGGRVGVRVRVLDPEALGAVRAHAGDDAGHAGDGLAGAVGQPGPALDVVDPDGARLGRSGRGGALGDLALAVGRRRGAGREVGGVVVGVRQTGLAGDRGGVGGAGHRGGALVDHGGAEADDVAHPRVGGAVGRGLAGQRVGAADQRDGAAGAGQRQRAHRVRGGQLDGARRAGALADQVAPAGGDRTGQRGDAPLGVGAGRGRYVLDAPAVQTEGGAALVGQLDEVVLQRGARVAAAAVDLGDQRVRGRRGHGGGQRGQHQGGGQTGRDDGRAQQGAARARTGSDGHGHRNGAPSSGGAWGSVGGAGRPDRSTGRFDGTGRPGRRVNGSTGRPDGLAGRIGRCPARRPATRVEIRAEVGNRPPQRPKDTRVENDRTRAWR